MTIRINRYHEPADLSAHRGMLLNPDFGFHADRLVDDFTLVADRDRQALQARIDRLDRRLRVARAAASILALVLVLAAIGLL